MANTLTPEKSQTYQEKWNNFVGFVRSGPFPPEVYNDLLPITAEKDPVLAKKKWYEFLHKYQSYHFDPQSYPVPVAVTEKPHIEEPLEEHGESHGFHFGNHRHPPEPEVIEEDHEYEKIADEEANKWLKEHNQKNFDTKEGMDFLYGSLDDPTKESLDTLSTQRFRGKFTEKTQYYDKLDEERRKIIEKRAEKDNAFVRAREKVKEEYEARVKLLDKQTKQEQIRLTDEAIKRRNEELRAKIEAKHWGKFAKNYHDKAVAYASQHQALANALQQQEGYVPTPPVVRRKENRRGIIGTVNSVWDQYQNADSLTSFFKNVFFGGGQATTSTAAETGIVGGEAALSGQGIAAAAEVAALGEGAVVASEAAAAGETALAAGEAALAGGATTAAGGTTAGGTTAAGTVVVGGAAAGGTAAAGSSAAAAGAGAAATGVSVAAGGTGATVSAPVWIWIVAGIVVALLVIAFIIAFVVIIIAAACTVVNIPVAGGIIRTIIDIDCDGSTTTKPALPTIPGLTLEMDGPFSAKKDDEILYKITAIYNGSLDVTIYDEIPFGLTFMNASGNFDKTTNSWSLGENTPTSNTGGVKTYTFTITFKPLQDNIRVTNRVVAKADDAKTASLSGTINTAP